MYDLNFLLELRLLTLLFYNMFYVLYTMSLYNKSDKLSVLNRTYLINNIILD
jgi:hypothetical protein